MLDQWTKYVVRTSPDLHRWEIIPGWLEFLYLKNPGMALGLDFFPTELVSVVSILATIAILVYTLKNMSIATNAYLFFIGCVLGGAVGNIIDRLIMGYIEGTGGLLQGHVVDFIHFSLTIGDFSVFPYVFNVADSFISGSVIAMLIFFKQVFPEEQEAIEPDSATNEALSNEPAQ